jgi:hypothetical protein
MSKACQYATNENKLNASMKEVSLKDSQVAFQKTSLRLRTPKKVDINGKNKSLFLVMHCPTKKMSSKCKRTTNKVVCTLLD